jgi:hypothetical protein
MRARLHRALGLLLAFSPAAVSAGLVSQHAVNVPVWDDWERAPLAAAWQEGTLGLADLYAPHIDHRIVFPRLLMLANFELSGGDLGVEMGFAFAIVLAGAAALSALLHRTLTRGALLASFFANLLLFSPLQWENFLWSIQTAFLLPLACLSGTLLALVAPLSTRARFAVCLALAVVATHSFGHGLLLWPAVAAYVLLEPGGRPKRGFLAAWLLAAALVLVPYFRVGDLESQSFHAYGRVPGQDAPALDSALGALAAPDAALAFGLRMLGSPLARTPWWPSEALAAKLGLLLLALLVAAAFAARRPETRRSALPWLVLGGAGVAGCALTALGRSGLRLDPDYALVPRYAAISTQLVVALVALSALLLPRRATALAALVLSLALAWAWNAGREGMAVWRDARLHARTSLVYIQHFAPRFAQRLDWSADSARGWATQYDRYGHLDPPLSPEPDLAPFAVDEALAPEGRAEVLRAVVRDGALRVRGRAASHGVLLTQRAEGAEPRVLAIGELRTPAPRHYEHQDHIFNEVARPAAEPERWDAEIPLAALPPGSRVEIEVWAVDAAAMRVARLARRIVVRRAGERLAVSMEPS